MSRAKVALPPRGALVPTAADDPLPYYYRPLLGRLYRRRLALVAGLLGRDRYESLLDVGYGSGIFFAELARRADRVAGVDVHGCAGEVAERVRALGVEPELVEASLYELPFRDGEFDAVV